MNKLYLAQMLWCEREEPIIAGTNKRKLLSAALKLLKERHGTGPVNRGSAMCHVPITSEDVEIVEIPFLYNTANRHVAKPTQKETKNQ